MDLDNIVSFDLENKEDLLRAQEVLRSLNIESNYKYTAKVYTERFDDSFRIDLRVYVHEGGYYHKLTINDLGKFTFSTFTRPKDKEQEYYFKRPDNVHVKIIGD